MNAINATEINIILWKDTFHVKIFLYMYIADIRRENGHKVWRAAFNLQSVWRHGAWKWNWRQTNWQRSIKNIKYNCVLINSKRNVTLFRMEWSTTSDPQPHRPVGVSKRYGIAPAINNWQRRQTTAHRGTRGRAQAAERVGQQLQLAGKFNSKVSLFFFTGEEGGRGAYSSAGSTGLLWNSIAHRYHIGVVAVMQRYQALEFYYKWFSLATIWYFHTKTQFK